MTDLLEKSKEFKQQGYKLTYTTEDENTHFFTKEGAEFMLMLSNDTEASEAFAKLVDRDKDNPRLPHIMNHIILGGDLHLSIMERLYSVNEIPGGPDGILGRMARNFTNVLVQHDPARGTSHNHDDAYQWLLKEDGIQRVGRGLGQIFAESVKNGALTLDYYRNRQTVMFRKVGKMYEPVYMNPIRSVGHEARILCKEFGVELDLSHDEAEAMSVKKIEERFPILRHFGIGKKDQLAAIPA